jgi:hypothetical protein
VSLNITYVNDIETSNVLLLVDDGTGSTHIASSCNHDKVADLELEETVNLVRCLNGSWVWCAWCGRWDGALGKKELDGIVDLDSWVGVSDCSAVVCDEVWDTLGTELDTLDLAELVLALFWADSVDGKSALDIVEETEVLAGLVNGDDI